MATLFALGACGHSEMVDAPHPCDPTMLTKVAVSYQPNAGIAGANVLVTCEGAADAELVNVAENASRRTELHSDECGHFVTLTPGNYVLRVGNEQRETVVVKPGVLVRVAVARYSFGC